MKFAFKFKLPKWEKPKPEVPYVSNPMIEELEKLDFTALTAERRHDVLLRIKHSAAAVAEDRRRHPAILTDRIRLQRLWVDYFKINQTVPPGRDEGESLSFAHSDQNSDLSTHKRAPGALMSTQEELVAQANFKIDMGDMTMDDLDDFDTPPPRLPPRPMPAPINHDFSDVKGSVLVVKHPETGDNLKIAGLHDLVIDPPETTLAALATPDATAPQTDLENNAENNAGNNTPSDPPPAEAPVVVVHSDEEPQLSADEQAEIVARMRALAQAEAAALAGQAEAPLQEDPMVARMRALAAAKASGAQAEPAAPAMAGDDAALVIEMTAEMTGEDENEDEDLPLVLDLSALEQDAATETTQPQIEPEPEPEPAPAAQIPEDQPPRLSAEDQIRLTEDMRARIKAETPADASASEDPMLARMRKLAQKSQEPAVQEPVAVEKPAAPAALTISIPEDPVEPEPELPAAPEETFEQIKTQIVADTLQQAKSAHLQEQGTPQPPAAVEQTPVVAQSEENAFEAGMLDRLRRLAGLSTTAKQTPEIAPQPATVEAKATTAEPLISTVAPPEKTGTLPPAAQPVSTEPVVAIQEPKPEPPKPLPPREREASATPSTRDWVNVKLLRPTVIRGLPLPDQVITIVPYPDAKRLEENGSVQILTKPRAPRSS